MNDLRVFFASFLFCSAAVMACAAPPNVILIMTDDQGYGDFGITGNPVISTPNLDSMAQRGVWMKTFYVSPVCSPTRASLMTGRYNYRTRVVDTFVGRSMMDPDEVTLAEVLRGAGYTTGIFGKWHLGDNYPLRAMDQGFDESFVLRGGGLAQPSDVHGNNKRYTNPMLVHNGVAELASGYCTDAFFNAAIEWIKNSRASGKPFFAYITPNAPHDPLHDVPEDLRMRYAERDMAQLMVQPSGQPRHGPDDALARIAAMITNIDNNVRWLLKALDAEGLSENTLVIYLNDNGPATMRYAGPFRGMKSEVREGGVRSPLWMLWPGKLKAGYTREEAVAHIDLMPTILEACGVPLPEGVKLDGRSFWRLATGESDEWPTRPLVIQTHRGDVPARRHHFMIRKDSWKLVHASGFGRENFTGEPKFELYNLANDLGETNNLASAQPDVVAHLLSAYDAWFDDVSRTRPDNYAPPRIHIGTPHENPVTLTRQDWRGGTWAEDAIGWWLINAEAGQYEIKVRCTPKNTAGVVEVHVSEISAQQFIDAGAETCVIESIDLPQGDAEFHAVIRHGDTTRGVYQLEVRRK